MAVLLLAGPLDAHAEVPSGVAVTSVNDTGATVTWRTSAGETSKVEYGPGTCAATQTFALSRPDLRGDTATTTFHYVRIVDLTPTTAYCFRPVSGTTVGSSVPVGTGPTLSMTAPDTMFGRVTVTGGAPVSEAFVQVTATSGGSTSARLSTLVRPTDDGYYSVSMGSFRTGDAQASFPLASDATLSISVDGTGGIGSLSTTVGVARAGQLPTISLSAAITVTGVTPTQVWPGGGTILTITGTGFDSGTTVKVGGQSAPVESLTSATQLAVRTPSAPGFADFNGDGQTNVIDALCILRYDVRRPSSALCPESTWILPADLEVLTSAGSKFIATGLIEYRRGDANGDGSVDVIDALCVLRYDVRRTPSALCPALLP